MKKILTLLFFTVCIALSLWVVAHNTASTSLSLGFMSLTQPLWVWLLASSFVGFLVTALVFQARMVALKLKVRQLKKKTVLHGQVERGHEKSLDDQGSSRLIKVTRQKK